MILTIKFRVNVVKEMKEDQMFSGSIVFVLDRILGCSTVCMCTDKSNKANRSHYYKTLAID